MDKSIFCCRENEMGVLRREWARVVDHCQPQVVMLLADNGLGKTRLVQEFYGWLSTQMDKPGAEGYWPDALQKHGDNLDVNPPLDECRASVDAPFLWWGLRFQDVEQRNAAVAGMDASLRDLAEHLAASMVGVRNQDRRRRAFQALGDAGVDFALEFFQTVSHAGLVKTAASLLIKSWGIGREYLADRGTPSLTDLRRREQASKAERIVKSFAEVMSARDNRLPFCIFADDAHFSDADPDTVDLLRRLLDAARKNGWPLLMVVTHWQDRWNREASELARWLKPQAPRIKVASFSTLDPRELAPVLTQHMPGLLPKQAADLLARADGNPQFLEEIIAFMARRARLFEGLDPHRPLKPQGLAEVMRAATGRHALNTIRFQALPREMQGVLAIGSLQGQRLSHSLTAEVAAVLNVCDVPASLKAIKDAEMPHNLLRREAAWAEYLQRLYREIAEQELPNQFEDVEAVRKSLAAALRSRVNAPDAMGSLATDDRQATLGLAWELLHGSSDEEEASVGALAAAILVGERLARRDYLSAGAQARALVDAMRARTFH